MGNTHNIDLTSSMPPTEMVMPALPQAIFTYGNIVPLLIIAFIAVKYARENHTLLPFYFLTGGFFAMFIEPVVDVLGLCFFPDHGSWRAFRAFDVTIPMFIVPVYIWYVGGQAFLTYKKLEDGVTRLGMFKLWVTFAVVNAVLEIPGLQLGVYTYYGDQPFQVLGFPLWWTFCNALMPITAATLVFKLKPYLTGWRLAAVIPLVPMADGLANGSVSWPTWVALNSGLGYSATYPAALISLCLALLFIYVIGLVVGTDSPMRTIHTQSN